MTRSAGARREQRLLKDWLGLAWPLAGALSSGEPWAVMTAPVPPCHPAIRPYHPPPRFAPRPSPFEEGRPQISALSSLITTNATSSFLPDPSFETTQLLKTRLFARSSRSTIAGFPQTVLKKRPLPPRRFLHGPQHDARSNTRVHKDKRAEDIVGHPNVRGIRYRVSWERQTRDISPSASCCSRLSSSAHCVPFRGSST